MKKSQKKSFWKNASNAIDDMIRRRELKLQARWIVRHRQTIRNASAFFKVPRQTLYNRLTTQLPKYDPALALQVSELLASNKKESTIRGGEATKRKYDTSWYNDRHITTQKKN